MQNINEIEELIKIISKLPGLGPKSAKRIVLKLVNNKDELVKPMAKALADVYKNILRCKICGVLKPSSIECSFNNCQIVEKKYDKICVVESIGDQWSIESSNIYEGYFHILGGTVSSVGKRKEDLLINSLIERVKKGKIDEVIIATSATVEGQTTAHYIAEQIENKVSVTSLARGVPMGGELDYLDEGTISAALNARGKI